MSPITPDHTKPKISCNDLRPVRVSAAAADAIDGVMILGTLPETVVAGEETEVNVLIAYTLFSSDKAELSISFNTDAPNTFRTAASVVVEKGQGETTLSARVSARTWGDTTLFQVSAHMTPEPRDMEGPVLVLAHDREPILVVPAP